MIKLAQKIDGKPHNSTKTAGFINKLFHILENPLYSKFICWNQNGESLKILNSKQLESRVLAFNFRHKNYHSFIRQLNMYGFKKIQKTIINKICSFSHPLFRKDCKSSLHLIKTKYEIKRLQRLERQSSMNNLRNNALSEESYYQNFQNRNQNKSYFGYQQGLIQSKQKCCNQNQNGFVNQQQNQNQVIENNTNQFFSENQQQESYLKNFNKKTFQNFQCFYRNIMQSSLTGNDLFLFLHSISKLPLQTPCSIQFPFSHYDNNIQTGLDLQPISIPLNFNPYTFQSSGQNIYYQMMSFPNSIYCCPVFHNQISNPSLSISYTHEYFRQGDQ